MIVQIAIKKISGLKTEIILSVYNVWDFVKVRYPVIFTGSSGRSRTLY